ncbi:MAG: type I-E CRISPR-associated protein Cas5/CasD [Lachnospiraceae bacterium]|nr:type I-E CRISPR-associated protein Cas5/CasD [Lachnospiraceae bacterium]
MFTLLLRFAAPLQSWGVNAKFNTRYTEREPSKSAVLGIVAAALGIRRNESLGDLSSMRYGVRVDKEGKLLQDYHTAHICKENSKKVDVYVTYRHYLSDAVFLVGLEHSEKEYLEKLKYALSHPVFPLFLGRRSCPPVQPFIIGIREAPVDIALTNENWQISSYLQDIVLGKRIKAETVALRMVIEEENGEVVRRDVPISYDPTHRKYGFRRVSEKYLKLPLSGGENVHDAMGELEG